MDRFEERHRAVLRLIDRLNEQHENVAALVVPVITLGCVEFKEIDQGGNFIFERIKRTSSPATSINRSATPCRLPSTMSTKTGAAKFSGGDQAAIIQ